MYNKKHEYINIHYIVFKPLLTCMLMSWGKLGLFLGTGVKQEEVS